VINNKLPEIAMLPGDMSRLDLLAGAHPRYRDRVRHVLARELARARVLSTADTPKDLVTMHSTVRFRDDDTERIQTAMLIYPGEEDDNARTVSVLTPTGCALIGLSEEQSIEYEADDGRISHLTVLEVVAHSDAHRPKIMPNLRRDLTPSVEPPSTARRFTRRRPASD